MRFAENPRDRVAGFRVAQLLPGVGPKIAETIVAAAAEDDGFAAMSALDAAGQSARGLFRLRRPHAPPRVARRALAGRARRRRRLALAACSRRATTTRRRGLGDLEALERIAASFASRERFLSELTLDPPDATSDEAGPPLRDEDYLILSTIHSAKGQEWRSVFVLNCVDGCIPSDLATGSSEEIEEERRLLYVAMTRARDELDADRPAALLCPRPAEERRPQRLRRPHPLHPAAAPEAFRPPDLAGRAALSRRARSVGRAARRSRGADAGDVAVSRSSDARLILCPDLCTHEQVRVGRRQSEKCARRIPLAEIEALIDGPRTLIAGDPYEDEIAISRERPQCGWPPVIRRFHHAREGWRDLCSADQRPLPALGARTDEEAVPKIRQRRAAGDVPR